MLNKVMEKLILTLRVVLLAVMVAISQNFRWAAGLLVTYVLGDAAIPWEPHLCWGAQ